MPNKNAHDDSMIHYPRTWYQYLTGEPGGYSISTTNGPQGQASLGRKNYTADDMDPRSPYSSVRRAVIREENPMSDPATRRKYPGTPTYNPMKLVSRGRQLRKGLQDPTDTGIAEEGQLIPEMQRRKEALLNGGNLLDDADALKNTVDSFVESDEFRNGLTQTTGIISNRLAAHYQETKAHPAWASTHGRWKLEEEFYAAKKAMREKHKKDAEDLVKRIEEDALAEMSRIQDTPFPSDRSKTYIQQWRKELGLTGAESLEELPQDKKKQIVQKRVFDKLYQNMKNSLPQEELERKYGNEIRNLPLGRSVLIKDILEADNEEARELRNRICAQELLSPIHTKELEDLEKESDISRLYFLRQHDRNMRWARIVDQQDERLLAEAQRIHRQTCEENRRIERARMQEQQEEEEKKRKDVFFSITTTRGTDSLAHQGEILPDEYLLANDPEGLPTLEEFKQAAEKTGIKFQMARWHYFPMTYSRSYQNKPLSITFGENGSVAVLFDKGLKPEQIRRDPNIRDACEDLAETLWASHDQKNPPTPPEERKADLVASSEAHAEVLVRAALMRGFKVENLTMTIKSDVTNTADQGRKYNIATEAPMAIELAKKYKRYVDYQAENSVERLLGRTPAVVLEQEALYRNEDAYNDAMHAFEEIAVYAQAGEESLSPAQHKAFAEAVNRLNKIQFGHTRTVLGRAQNAAGGIASGALSAVGGLLVDSRLAAHEIFKGGQQRGDQTLAVKESYSLDERKRIAAAAQSARDALQADWEKISSQNLRAG